MNSWIILVLDNVYLPQLSVLSFLQQNTNVVLVILSSYFSIPDGTLLKEVYFFND